MLAFDAILEYFPKTLFRVGNWKFSGTTDLE